MRVLEVVNIQLQWSDLDNLTIHPRPDLQARDKSLPHLSDILRKCALALNMYTDEDRDDDMPLMVLLGMGFEESAARLYKDMHWQPSPVRAGGVIGSMDALSPVSVPANTGLNFRSNITCACVDEFKYTGKSQRVKGAKTQLDGTVRDRDLKDIRGEWIWVHQGMGYINLLRRAEPELYGDLDLARFHICWKYGPYTYPMKERYVRYLVQFSQEDLDGNWSLIQANK